MSDGTTKRKSHLSRLLLICVIKLSLWFSWMSIMFSANIIKVALKELSKLPAGLKAEMVEAIEELEQVGTDLKEPKVRDVGNGLKELRVSAQEGIARGFFFFTVGKQFYVVHVLHKKSQKTPKLSLELANQRMKDIKRRLKNV